MRKSALWTIPLFALLSAASGCQTPSSANDGAGFAALHPSAGTRQFIVANDKPFAKEVVAHNATCAMMKACAK